MRLVTRTNQRQAYRTGAVSVHLQRLPITRLLLYFILGPINSFLLVTSGSGSAEALLSC